MRTGGYTIQQTLTTEAASVLKHSLTLARRRGHAQVTPLHVAATLLSSRTSLLRRACIKSHPGFSTNYQFAPSRHLHHHHQNQNHPLQCRALELCFNVALNRLPTVPGPMFHGQPSLANALVAALKRAQAHQRRGCIEQQQTQQTQTQPQTQQTQLLAVKVELEQLVISILDDPSVSRVMREAGFNSTAVKNCVEDCSAVSSVFYGGGSVVGVFSSPNSPDQQQYHNNINRLHHYQNPKDFNFVNPTFPLWQTPFLNQSPDQNPLLISSSSSHPHHHYQRLREIDLKLILDVLQRKKTKKNNPVIVGDSVSFTEGFVSELMAKLERGEIDQTGDLKQTQFVKFQFSPMAAKFMRREDVETNINELRKKVVCLTTSGKSVIIFTGDLTWTIKEISNNKNEGNDEISSSYSPLDHLVEEIGKLIAEYNEELDDDDCKIRRRVWVMGTASFQTYMRCQMRQPSLETLWALHPVSVPSSANLGLSLHATGGHEARNIDNVIATKSFSCCNKAEGEDDLICTILSCCPECVTSFEREAKTLKANQDKILPAWLQSHQTDNSSQKEEIIGLRRKWNRLCQNLHNQTEQSSLMSKNYSYGLPYGSPNESSRSKCLIDTLGLMPNQRATNSIAKFRRQNSCTIEFDLGGNEHEKSESINEAEDDNGNEKITLDLGRSLFRSDSITEASKKINALLKALEERIPWQTVTMRLIAESLMDCVSKKEDGWILIEGSDTTATRRLARTVSDSIFGSSESMVHIGLKRKSNESKASSETLLACGLENHEKAVFLIEDIELAESCFLKVLADRFEKKRRVKTGNDHRQAIFILTKEDSSIARNRGSVMQIGLEVTEQSLGRKRKPESNLTARENKSSKVGEIENGLWNKKEVFSRQSSFNSSYLDLNIKAEEDEVEEGGEISPISSDLTGEEETEISSSDFLNRIRNRFAVNRTREPGIEKAMITAAFREVFPEGEGGGVRFSVEEKLVEKLSGGNVQNGAFESWLKEVFQRGLLTVKKGGKKDTGVIRMVFGGIVDNKGYGVGVGGYMGTFLPNKVQVSMFD